MMARLSMWLLLALAAASGSCSKGEPMSLSVGPYALVFSKDSDLSASGMLFGFQTGEEVQPGAYYSGIMSFIEIDKVEELRAKYPDFHRCSSPGAAEAQSHVKRATLLAANSEVESSIKQIADLFSRAKNRIVVKLGGSVLTLKECKKAGEEIRMQGFEPHFYVERIEYEEKSS